MVEVPLKTPSGRRGPELFVLAKDLAVTAVLATAIFGSTIAFKTATAAGGLALVTRYDSAFYIIAAVVVGRLVLWLSLWNDYFCLLYTSDAADDLLCVDLG